jgi:hypothetical protein
MSEEQEQLNDLEFDERSGSDGEEQESQVGSDVRSDTISMRGPALTTARSRRVRSAAM